MATTPPPRDAAGTRRPRGPVRDPVATAAADSAAHAPGQGDAAPAADAAPALTMDSAFDAWSTRALRDHFAWEIATGAAMLRGAKAWREAQMQAAERAESVQLQASQRLLEAGSLNDLATIHFDLMRAHAEEAMQYATRLAELVQVNLNQAIEQVSAGWLRSSEDAMSGWSDWVRLQSQLPLHADVAEAEVEHLANPIAAMAWAQPAQEAMREATSMCLSAYTQWLESAGRWQGGPSAPAV